MSDIDFSKIKIPQPNFDYTNAMIDSIQFCPPLKNDGRGDVFFMVSHSCLSFLNEVKHPGRGWRY